MERSAEIAVLRELLSRCQDARDTLPAASAPFASWTGKDPLVRFSESLLKSMAKQQKFRCACGAVSRILWAPYFRDQGKYNGALQQAEYMRRTLGIEAEHPLHDPDLSGYREHFEEVVNDWETAQALGHVPPMAMGEFAGSIAGHIRAGRLRAVSFDDEFSGRRVQEQFRAWFNAVEDVSKKAGLRLEILERSTR